jgi:hypothetical protein
VSNRGSNGGRGQKGSNGGRQPPPPEKCKFGDFPRVQAVRIEPSSEDNRRYSHEQSDRSNQLELSANLNWITGISAGVSFLALLGLIASVVITKKALTLSKTATDAAVAQAKIAQLEFESSQRPWISLKVVEVGKLILVGNNMIIEPTAFTAKNSGHSVAENVSYKAFIVMSNKEDGTECDAAAGARKSAGEYAVGTVIFPGDEVYGQFNAYDFTPGGLDQEFKDTSTSGMIAPRLVACIVYSSPADKLPHYTRIPYWIFHKGTQNPNFSRDGGPYDIDVRPDFNGSTAK